MIPRIFGLSKEIYLARLPDEERTTLEAQMASAERFRRTLPRPQASAIQPRNATSSLDERFAAQRKRHLDAAEADSLAFLNRDRSAAAAAMRAEKMRLDCVSKAG